MLFLPLAALPSAAQRLAPVAPRGADASMMSVAPQSASPLAARRDTILEPRREISPVGTILGGVLGEVAGTFVGMYAGAASAEGCRGEECELFSAIIGAGIGESIGLGLGAHLGSGSRKHENVLLTTLTSTGILVGGALLSAQMDQAAIIMVGVIPALQLAATLAIESH